MATSSRAGAAVRPFRPGDEPAVARLLTELGLPTEAAAVRARLDTFGGDPRAHVLVAEQAERVIGVLGLHRVPLFHRVGDLARITVLVVADGHRGRGIGRSLVEAAERIAREARCWRVEVTSAMYLAPAHGFYERLGFAEKRRRFFKDLEPLDRTE
ncbi:MAG: GNAT family N-acetyltransferase [Gemmatimonadota bacterium]|jgi:GNAT superfamily N-acetyltransferase